VRVLVALDGRLDRRGRPFGGRLAHGCQGREHDGRRRGWIRVGRSLSGLRGLRLGNGQRRRGRLGLGGGVLGHGLAGHGLGGSRCLDGLGLRGSFGGGRGRRGRRRGDAQAELADRRDRREGGRDAGRVQAWTVLAGGTGAEDLVEHAANLARGGDEELDGPVELVANLLHRALVRRVGDRDEDARGRALDGHSGVVAAHALRKELRRVALVPAALEAHELEALLAGQEPGEVLLVDPALLEEDLAEPAARALPLLERGLELVLAEQAGPVDQGSERRVGPLPAGAVRLLHGG
jgi:hypothetical protein